MTHSLFDVLNHVVIAYFIYCKEVDASTYTVH